MALLTRWRPFGPLWGETAGLQRRMDQLQRRMERLFVPLELGVGSQPELAAAYPPVNLWEDDDFVYAEAELPGLKLENLEITATGDNQLAIKGCRQQTALQKVEWHRQERGFGSFERVIMLSMSVDPAKVEARLENGVLTIKMAKNEAAKPRKIPVKAQ